jgi:hypothetical protein
MSSYLIMIGVREEWQSQLTRQIYSLFIIDCIYFPAEDGWKYNRCLWRNVCIKFVIPLGPATGAWDVVLFVSIFMLKGVRVHNRILEQTMTVTVCANCHHYISVFEVVKCSNISILEARTNEYSYPTSLHIRTASVV